MSTWDLDVREVLQPPIDGNLKQQYILFGNVYRKVQRCTLQLLTYSFEILVMILQACDLSVWAINTQGERQLWERNV